MLPTEISLTRGKLWIGAAPKGWLVNSNEIRKKTIAATTSVTLNDTTLCLLLRFLGGLSHYGILGLTYKGSNDDTLELGIPILNEGNYERSVGLSDRYADHVLQEAVLTLHSLNNIAPGNLEFAYARLHPVDSNEFIFRLLTRVLIMILHTDLRKIDGNFVDEMIANHRKNILSRSTGQ